MSAITSQPMSTSIAKVETLGRTASVAVLTGAAFGVVRLGIATAGGFGTRGLEGADHLLGIGQIVVMVAVVAALASWIKAVYERAAIGHEGVATRKATSAAVALAIPGVNAIVAPRVLDEAWTLAHAQRNGTLEERYPRGDRQRVLGITAMLVIAAVFGLLVPGVPAATAARAEIMQGFAVIAVANTALIAAAVALFSQVREIRQAMVASV